MQSVTYGLWLTRVKQRVQCVLGRQRLPAADYRAMYKSGLTPGEVVEMLIVADLEAA